MSVSLQEAIKQVETLSQDEQLVLISTIAQKIRLNSNGMKSEDRYSWLDAVGKATHPMVGEDAQTWVSRTRAEGDADREKQWRR